MADASATVAGGEPAANRQQPTTSRLDQRGAGARRLGGHGGLWGWGGVGAAGSVLVALAGPRLAGGGAISWWFSVRFPPGESANTAVLYLGMVVLSVAWLGLGRSIAARAVRPRELWIVGLVWCLPLIAGPALFSHDVYSYLAQGTIVHLGLNPYRAAPVVLGHLGHQHVLDAVSPFWRRTTAPYGPLFLGLVSLIVSVSASNLIVGVLLIRLVELAGLVLLAIFIPRLARALGADPARATWLVLLSPLVLLQLVAGGHNDLLMVGLLVAGVTLALEDHPLLGVAVCAFAATIKAPAAVGALFIAVAWARSAPTASDGWRFLAKAGSIAVGVLAAVSVGTGLGLNWISTSLFSTPAKVHLAITPATGLGWTIASLLHDVGIGAASRSIESALGVMALGLTAVLGAWLLWKVRRANLACYLGVLLVAAAAGGPAAWPWYFSWGLVLLAACPRPQRSAAFPIAAVVAAFLVKANGILALPLNTSPVVVVAYVVIGALAWRSFRRRPAASHLIPSTPW